MVPTLRFSLFRETWQQYRLGLLTNKIGSGVTPRGGAAVYTNSGVLFIRSQNVKDDRLVIDDVVYISHAIHNTMVGSEVKPGDILLNITGASIGRSCVVPSDISLSNVNQHVCIIRLKNSCEPKLLQMILSSWRGQKLIYQQQAGGGREGLNFENISTFKINIPSLPEQKKIAAFLSAVDRKIQLLQKKKERLEQYKKGVMQKIFSREIRFKDENGANYPEWEEKRLEDYLIQHNEITIKNNQYPVLTSSRVGMFFQKDYFSGNEVASKDNTGYNVVPRGYFTYRHMSDDLVFKFNINHLCENGIVSTLYPVFTTNAMIDDRFLSLKLNEGEELKRYALLQKQGGSRTYLYYKRLKLLILLIPHISEQKQIANCIFSISNKIQLVKNQISIIQQFKKGLLQQMFV